jgi:hypothetical protein
VWGFSANGKISVSKLEVIGSIPIALGEYCTIIKIDVCVDFCLIMVGVSSSRLRRWTLNSKTRVRFSLSQRVLNC